MIMISSSMYFICIHWAPELLIIWYFLSLSLYLVPSPLSVFCSMLLFQMFVWDEVYGVSVLVLLKLPLTQIFHISDVMFFPLIFYKMRSKCHDYQDFFICRNFVYFYIICCNLFNFLRMAPILTVPNI